MAYTSYADMIADAHNVDGWHGPPPRCPACGTVLKLAPFPAVRWVCPLCVKWAWVEPPDAEPVWPDAAMEGA